MPLSPTVDIWWQKSKYPAWVSSSDILSLWEHSPFAVDKWRRLFSDLQKALPFVIWLRREATLFPFSCIFPILPKPCPATLLTRIFCSNVNCLFWKAPGPLMRKKFSFFSYCILSLCLYPLRCVGPSPMPWRKSFRGYYDSLDSRLEEVCRFLWKTKKFANSFTTVSWSDVTSPFLRRMTYDNEIWAIVCFSFQIPLTNQSVWHAFCKRQFCCLKDKLAIHAMLLDVAQYQSASWQTLTGIAKPDRVGVEG